MIPYLRFLKLSMKEGNTKLYNWNFQLQAAPKELWPFVSDTDKVFESIGLYSIQKTPFSRSNKKGFLELATTRLSSYLVWQEEPYLWEKPHKFGCTRNYKIGIFRRIRFLVTLRKSTHGTIVNCRIWMTTSHTSVDLFLKVYLERIIKLRIARFLDRVDKCAQKGILGYELNSQKPLVRGAKKRLRSIHKNLVDKTRRQRIVNHLFEYIQKADDQDLLAIHPYRLAEYWGEKKYSVLNVFLNASKIDLLDFKWEVSCPGCKKPKNSFRKMREIHPTLYCDECDISYQVDFNENTHLVFVPNPLIRKPAERKFCYGGPQNVPYRVTQHFLNIGEEKYLDIRLQEGTYLFKTDQHKGLLKLHVREDGPDNVSLYITDDDFDNQEAVISTRPNLSIINKSSKKVVAFLDKKNWKQKAIYASEVTSSHDFRTLFAKETLREGMKVHAEGITMLFTDLMNSTDLYRQEGDEFAIGQLMSHFKIIQQIVAEERGGIVKTIGDSVMAVFREPVSALKAVERIQEIFSSSTALGDSFKLKAGIHYGDCTVVNLNDRVDYFGTTVNIAARLVDVAKEKEIVVSEAFFKNNAVTRYLDRNRKSLFIKDSTKELKGFDNESFKVKEIRMERTPLRLVV